MEIYSHETTTSFFILYLCYFYWKCCFFVKNCTLTHPKIRFQKILCTFQSITTSLFFPFISCYEICLLFTIVNKTLSARTFYALQLKYLRNYISYFSSPKDSLTWMFLFILRRIPSSERICFKFSSWSIFSMRPMSFLYILCFYIS